MCKRERERERCSCSFFFVEAERLRVSDASLMWNLVSVGGLVRLKLTTRFPVQRKLGGQQLLRAPSCGTGALQVLKRIDKAKMADARSTISLFASVSGHVACGSNEHNPKSTEQGHISLGMRSYESTLPCVQCRFREATAKGEQPTQSWHVVTRQDVASQVREARELSSDASSEGDITRESRQHLWPPVHHAPRTKWCRSGRSICMYLYHYSLYSFNYSHIYWSWNRLISAYWMGTGCLTNSLIDEGHCQSGRRRSLVPSSTKWRKCHEVGTWPGRNSVHVWRPADLNSTPYALAQSFQHDTRVYI